ncbi:MAG TPA: methyltransferase domain-containing protein [Polyangiaceae bacterium]|nr:methyltransferase domain-containing protein [Polyangiaceae bacterium]
MGRKRRQVTLEDPARWVFNRMAEHYPARPAYPAALIQQLAGLSPERRVLDLGAGTGHIALPLARLGFEVTAVDAAGAMVEALRAAATREALPVNALHARAEEVPFERAAFDLVIVADALHFLDVELTAAQVRRVLAPGGSLALVTTEFADTPYMRAVREAMQSAAPRRPRSVAQAVLHLASLSQVDLRDAHSYRDDHPMDVESVEQILRSVSFIGPAMNAVRFARFQAALRAIPYPVVWSREFTLQVGRRRRGP